MRQDQFECDECGGIFDLGDKEEALAEAATNGFDPSDCGIVCDACYEAIMARIKTQETIR